MLPIESWDEIRTAYQVARRGTVSGAAAALEVHHATVIRHVDALERRLGVKLFQRHARGYTPTEAGSDLFNVAQTTEEQFAQLVSRVRGRGEAVTGELIVTSLVSLAPKMVPLLARFRAAHPEVRVRYLTGDTVLRLQYGEAHVAIRAGAAPQEPDNVVQPFAEQRTALFGSRPYLRERGRPESDAALQGHDFVGIDDAKTRSPFHRWMHQNIPQERIVFRANDNRVLREAVLSGAGLGFIPVWDAIRYPDLVEVLPPRPEWSAPLWLVTHVDLHRSVKVQTFVTFIKEAVKTAQAEVERAVDGTMLP